MIMINFTGLGIEVYDHESKSFVNDYDIKIFIYHANVTGRIFDTNNIGKKFQF